MHTVHIGPDPIKEVGPKMRLLEDLMLLEKQQVKTYSFSVHYLNVDYLLTTTSKDVALGLARLDPLGLRDLCFLFEEEFESSGKTQMLLITQLQPGENARKEGLLITAAGKSDKHDKVYHLSPANR